MARSSQPHPDCPADLPQPWADSEAACGEHYLALPGGQHLWFFSGKASEGCRALLQLVRGIMQTETYGSNEAELDFFMYMMGEKKISARPILLVCSPDIERRKRALELIKRSKILDGLPHVLLGGASSLETLGSAGPR